jgi:hypothetical protein
MGKKELLLFFLFKSLVLPKHSGYHDHHCFLVLQDTGCKQQLVEPRPWEYAGAVLGTTDSGRQSAQAACLTATWR